MSAWKNFWHELASTRLFFKSTLGHRTKLFSCVNFEKVVEALIDGLVTFIVLVVKHKCLLGISFNSQRAGAVFLVLNDNLIVHLKCFY